MQGILDTRWHVFVKVSELGGVSRAAVALDVPQSMVSRYITQLEFEWGNRLFRRTGRGVVLTEFGQRLYPRVKGLIADADQLADDIRTTGGLALGEVRVGLLPSTVPLLAGLLYTEVSKHLPNVQLHLSEGSGAQLEEWIKDGRVDMALVLREIGHSDRSAPVLCMSPLHLVMRIDDPLGKRKTVTFAEVEKLPLILPSRPHGLRGMLDRMAHERNIQFNVKVEADSIYLHHELVVSGAGYAMTIGHLGPGYRERLKCVPIVRPQLVRTITLASSMHRPTTLATREVSRLLLALGSPLLRV